MDAKFDFSALLNEAIISGLAKEKDGQECAAVLQVFAKHGVGVVDALAILLEVATIIAGE